MLFGQIFIAGDASTAKKVAMENPNNRYACVTLEGDMYRNDGALTGGS